MVQFTRACARIDPYARRVRVPYPVNGCALTPDPPVCAKQAIKVMAEDRGLMHSDDGASSEEEALIYISDERHPSGASKRAETRR